MPIEVICEVCGDIFNRRPSKAEPPNYCSKDCFYKSRRERKEYTCPNCGDTFKRINSDVSNENPCCSEKCKYEYRSKKKTVIIDCDYCGSDIKRRKFRIGENNYCDHKCYSASKEKDDISWHNKAAHRKWANKVKEGIDECEKCGSEEDLHAHHIIPVAIDPELRDDPENGVAICAECHSKEHPNVPEKLIKNATKKYF